ncbi:uncharacterized protein LOC143209526 [Lasioglossum baleicum]|uniref:uncharacterized protein LOC143209526 n=1 Tax=Lasioglossum baleicum TaxID=434251 RepID=UPI003FCD90ED
MPENKEKEEEKPVVAKNAIDLQRLKLQKLMKNPEKPVILPERPKAKSTPTVPEFVRNVMGSSAGAGSGEFHVYRHLRRKEYARQKFIQEKGRKELLDAEYHLKLEENKRAAEQVTAKKRAKRQKKKQKLKGKKKQRLTNDEPNKNNEDSNSEDDSPDPEDRDDNEPEAVASNEIENDTAAQCATEISTCKNVVKDNVSKNELTLQDDSNTKDSNTKIVHSDNVPTSECKISENNSKNDVCNNTDSENP